MRLFGVIFGYLGFFGGLGGQVDDQNPCRVTFDGGASGVGVHNRTFNGVEYCQYLGIRYAEPPVGSLRFKSPVLRAPKGSEKFTKLGSICAQLDAVNEANDILGDEDCLFVNVYSPVVPGSNNLDRKYPVLVYIHGGSYAIWSPQTDMFGEDLLVESEVLTVTFNYRLSVLGFLRHPEFNVTGNYGLKDHLAALQWVKRYIEPFGGDPNNVTLMGQSVGAHSVTYHMYLEPFRGLFHRAIAMSGSLLAPSAMIYNPERYVPEYLKAINVGSYDQLMNASFQDLFMHSPSKRRFAFGATLPIFLPVVEDDSDPEALITKPASDMIFDEPVNKVPLMIGMTSLEFVSLFSIMSEFRIDANFPNRKNRSLLDQVTELLHKANALAEKVDPAGAGRHFYGKTVDLSNMYYPVTKFMQNLVESDSFDQPIYYYRFEFDGKFGKYKNQFYKGNLDSSYEGAMHGDDLGYLFSPYIVKEALDNKAAYQAEWKVSEVNVAQISNFVKFGNPTPDVSDRIDTFWPPYNGNGSMYQYLNINEHNEVRLRNDRPNFSFQVWRVIHDCLYYFKCSEFNEVLNKITHHLRENHTSIALESLFDEENML